MREIEIWYPRFSKKDCCVLASKVGDDSFKYCIYFSKDPAYKGNRYVMTGKEIRENGTLEKTAQGGKSVYAIPLDVLERFKA